MDSRLDVVRQFARDHGVDLEEQTAGELEWSSTARRYEPRYGGKNRYLRWFASGSRWCMLGWTGSRIRVGCNDGYRNLASRTWDVPAGADDDTYRAFLAEAKAWGDEVCRNPP